MSLRRLVLWRHGETEHNATGRMQGHLDSALTETGWNQARLAVPALARFEPDLVIASDLRRAADSATVLTGAIGVPLRIDMRLREANLGEWQGQTGREVDALSPGERERWRLDATFAPPGGESRVDIAKRGSEVVTELLHKGTDSGTVLLASHGGLIVALTAHLLSLPVALWPSLGGITNCHWVDLRMRNTVWRLHAYNAGLISD